MFNDLLKLSRLVMRMYWQPIVAWCALQVIVIGIFRKVTIVEAIQPPFASPPSNLALFTMAGFIVLSFMILIIFLGHLFSSGQRGSWIRQLPIGAAALNLFPLSVIFLYGLAILLLIPWGAFTNGVSVFCISIPIAVFLTLKNSSEIISGLFKSAGVGVLLVLLWAYGFFDWSAVNPKLIVESAALIIFSIVWLLVGRQERRYTAVISIGLVLLIGCQWFIAENVMPLNFSEAVLNHDFNRSEKTWQNFKRVALDPQYWEGVDQFDLPPFVRFRSQDFIQKFSSDEKIIFIQNIGKNQLRWVDVKLPKYRLLRFASFPQPELRFSDPNPFPIGNQNIDEATENYLYSNWLSSRLYCQILPPRPTRAYLAKVFLDTNCYPDLFHQAPWTFSLFEISDYTNSLDQYLLNAYKNSPSLTRRMMMIYLFQMWGLEELADKYKGEKHVLFDQKDVTPERLSEIKADRFRKSLTYLKALPNGREAFLREIDRANVQGSNSQFPSLLLCQYIFTDCFEFLNQKKSAKIRLLEAWQQRLHALSFDEADLWMYWISEELRKEKNWPRIEKLITYAKSRNDL